MMQSFASFQTSIYKAQGGDPNAARTSGRLKGFCLRSCVATR